MQDLTPHGTSHARTLTPGRRHPQRNDAVAKDTVGEGMILAGDIGGTKTNLALFDGDARVASCLETYPSDEYHGLAEIIGEFLADHPAEIEEAAFGVAGPVHEGRVEKINLEWAVDAAEIAASLGLARVGLLNDLEANAWGIRALGPNDVEVLHPGDPDAEGNQAVIAAGTGLGEAGLYWDGTRHHVFPSEGGHADFAPRTELQLELWRYLSAHLRHVSYERVCSGMGLVNIYGFLRSRRTASEPDWLREEMEAGDPAAAISNAALVRRDETCIQALDLMVEIYGAEAGNLALKLMATGGVYVGGGIAPKILPKLTDGAFARQFVGKGRFTRVLERIPVRVILNDRTALLGAAVYAQSS
jgi:glucokinase